MRCNISFPKDLYDEIMTNRSLDYMSGPKVIRHALDCRKTVMSGDASVSGVVTHLYSDDDYIKLKAEFDANKNQPSQKYSDADYEELDETWKELTTNDVKEIAELKLRVTELELQNAELQKVIDSEV